MLNSRSPLADRGILSLRPIHQSEEFRRLIESRGGRFYSFPVLTILPPSDEYKALDRAIRELSLYQGILFTSVNGVDRFFDRLEKLKETVPSSVWFAAIGPKSAAALERRGVKSESLKGYPPRRFTGEGFCEWLLSKLSNRPTSLLLPRAEVARPELPDGLRRAGHSVTVVSAYRTVGQTEVEVGLLRTKLATREIDTICFTSASTVTCLLELIPARDLIQWQTRLASIGPITSGTLRIHGLVPTVEVTSHTIAGLVEALLNFSTNPVSVQEYP